MLYKHAIWDWNGTLLNDTLLCVEVLNGLLARRGRAMMTTSDYRENFGFPVIHFYEYLGFDADVDTFEQVSREFIRDYEKRWFDECILYQGAREVLSAMTQLGMTHSVLSAAKQEALESGIQHYGIREYFMGLVGANNIYAEGKVAQGKQWIKQLPREPEEVVMIGDTLHDHEVAEAIGTDCILLAHGHHTPERLAATGKRVVQSLGELLEAVR
ncbi:MAG: HAD family hydrolase [Verrucomicrobiota bacterium]|nr:HAD family hydrolase [Verrucomicrobiota bacterium]